MTAAAELAAAAAAAEAAKRAKLDPQIGWRKFAASQFVKPWLTVVTDAALDPDGREPGLCRSLCSEFGKNVRGLDFGSPTRPPTPTRRVRRANT